MSQDASEKKFCIKVGMTIGHYKIDHRFMHDVNKVPKSMRAFGLAPLSPLARFSFYFRSDFFLYREYLQFFATNKFGRSSRERRTGVCVCVLRWDLPGWSFKSDWFIGLFYVAPTYLPTYLDHSTSCLHMWWWQFLPNCLLNTFYQYLLLLTHYPLP